ncbi:MAG: helix-turn-helix domain-containing protein [Pyrinomonadaceae bacterium]
MTRCHYQIVAPRTPYPHTIVTIGDALRKRRLEQGLTVKNVAEQLDVNEATIRNWETNRRTVQLRFRGQVHDFIGVCPCGVLLPFGARLKERREYAGFTRKALAEILTVDEHTVSAWERSKYSPTSVHVGKIFDFLKNPFSQGRNSPANEGSNF